MQRAEIAHSHSGAAFDSLVMWGCLIAALAISVAYSSYYPSPMIDDSMIVYRYSERLLHGQGLTWNNGEFVEGYSDLLWVLLVALGGLVEPNLILVGRVLGLVANAAVLVAIVWTFGRSSVTSSLRAVIGGLLVLSLSRAFAFWGIGGLETALFEALLAWALATTYRMPAGRWGWVLPGMLFGLLSITRPDGILFGVSTSAALFILGGFSWASVRRAATLVALPFLFVGAQTGFRLMYYGDFVPNTAYAKVAFTLARVWGGSVYVAQGIVDNTVPLTIVLALLILMRRSQPLRQAGVFLIPGLIWLAYVCFIGGDIFPFYRHWMPALVCLAFSLASLLAMVPQFEPRRFVVLLVVAAALHVAFQRALNPWFPLMVTGPQVSEQVSFVKKVQPDVFSDPQGASHRVLRDCITLGQFLHTAFERQQPLVAVEAAGCLPYASQLPSIDMLGLTDSHLAHNRPADMGKGPLGGELGDAGYVLSRKPDIMVFSWSNKMVEPYFRWQRELIRMPEFLRNYRRVFVRAGSLEEAFWTRIEDGRVGIIRTDSSIQIPGFLLATTPDTRAMLDTSGNPVTALEHGDAAVTGVYFPPGTWEISLQSDEPHGLQLATSPTTDSTTLGPGKLRVVSTGATRSFRVSGRPGLVYAITALRLAQ